MSVEAFRKEPWKMSHETYHGSAFNLRPAPEFATAEVVLASTYRASGFDGHSENSVPSTGNKLAKATAKPGPGDRDRHISSATWRTILHGAIESPRQPNQSSRRHLQLCPIVPDVALYSGSPRLSGSSWNPGNLVAQIIRLGSSSEKAAGQLWADLHAGLSVGEQDDVWARWLQSEFERRRLPDSHWTSIEKQKPNWGPTSLGVRESATLADADKAGLRLPAVQMARDLGAILRAKSCMTRRQWVSLLESILRLGTVSHVLWLCDVNDRLWRTVRAVLDGADVPDEGRVRRDVIGNTASYLVYGNPALPIVRDYASRYLGARLGINLVLWSLEEHGQKVPRLSSAGDVVRFLEMVAQNRQALLEGQVMDLLAGLRDEHARTLACKRGIGSNIAEFCRYALGQRQTADESLRGYDQGYQLRKRAEYASAPWVVSLGPVAVLAVVHCCLAEAAGPRSVQRLSEHLAWYGIDVDRDDIGKGDLGRKLRMLGLVLDSPDAESGMLLVPPFDLSGIQGAGGVE